MTGLRLSDIEFGYGPTPTVSDINMHVDVGETVALLGGNGAGKSTVLKLIVGLERPWSGAIEVNGNRLTQRRVHRVARAGVRLVPQGHPVFEPLTVLENLQIAADIGQFTTGPSTRFTVEEALQTFPRLADRRAVHAGALSGGERALLGVAQPLVAGCSLLLLDEPSAGLAPSAMRKFFEILHQVSEETGVTMLIVEQNAHQVLPLCSRAYVMSEGTVKLEGRSEDLLADQQVVDAYLAY